MIGSSEKLVNIGCIDKTECPMLFINNVIDWALKTQSAYLLRRSERLEIDKRVREIAQSIKRQDNSS
jgi:arsenate reductase (thioredoxin)